MPGFPAPTYKRAFFDRFGDDLFQGINAVLDPFDQYKDVFVKMNLSASGVSTLREMAR